MIACAYTGTKWYERWWKMREACYSKPANQWRPPSEATVMPLTSWRLLTTIPKGHTTYQPHLLCHKLCFFPIIIVLIIWGYIPLSTDTMMPWHLRRPSLFSSLETKKGRRIKDQNCINGFAYYKMENVIHCDSSKKHNMWLGWKFVLINVIFVWSCPSLLIYLHTSSAWLCVKQTLLSGTDFSNWKAMFSQLLWTLDHATGLPYLVISRYLSPQRLPISFPLQLLLLQIPHSLNPSLCFLNQRYLGLNKEWRRGQMHGGMKEGVLIAPTPAMPSLPPS